MATETFEQVVAAGETAIADLRGLAVPFSWGVILPHGASLAHTVALTADPGPDDWFSTPTAIVADQVMTEDAPVTHMRFVHGAGGACKVQIAGTGRVQWAVS